MKEYRKPLKIQSKFHGFIIDLLCQKIVNNCFGNQKYYATARNLVKFTNDPNFFFISNKKLQIFIIVNIYNIAKLQLELLRFICKKNIKILFYFIVVATVQKLFVRVSPVFQFILWDAFIVDARMHCQEFTSKYLKQAISNWILFENWKQPFFYIRYFLSKFKIFSSYILWFNQIIHLNWDQ